MRRHRMPDLRLRRETLSLVLSLGLLAVLTLLPSTASSTISWRGDFETGDLSQWTYGAQQKEPGRISVVNSPVRQGRYAARFEVRPGDNNVAGSGTGERAEVLIPSATTDVAEGREAYWAWSTYFPADFTAPGGAWNVFTQFHHTGSTGQSNIHFDVRDMTNIGLRVMGGNESSPVRKDFILAPLRKGSWYDFVFHVKWSSDASVGFVEVWVNGSRVVPKTFTPTLYAGMTAYLKMGYYRAAYTAATVIYHDGMRRGSSYDEVAAEFPSSVAPTFAVASSIANGSILSGTMQWSAEPSGATASSVSFSVDGAVIATDTTAPYGVSLDTTSLTNVSHTFSVDATATDGAKASATSTATVSNQFYVPLSVTQNLVDGQTVSGSIPWTATPSEMTVSRVEFWIDGGLSWTERYAPYVYGGDGEMLDTRTLANGTHALEVRAYNADGSWAKATATVNVANSVATSPPASTFSITQNVWDGLRLAGEYRWVATPSGKEISRVTFFVDSKKVATKPQAPYEARLDTRTYPDGIHTLTVTAQAADGSTASPLAQVIFANQAPAPSPSPSPSSSTLQVTQSVATGQTLSGSISWTATTSGQTASRVEFWIDGRLSWTERYTPYVYGGDGKTLDTRTLADASHTLEVRAYAADGSTASASANVIVANQATAPPPPSSPTFAVLQSVATGQTLSGSISWTATTSGQTASRVEFWIDGHLSWTERYTPYVYGGDGQTLDTRTLGNGTHTLEVTAYAADGSTAKAIATVSISNLVPALVSSIRDGETISGLVTWTVEANGFSVSKIEFFIDSKLMWTERYVPYVYGGDGRQLDTTTLTRGAHVFEIRATGTDGSVRTLTLDVTVA